MLSISLHDFNPTLASTFKYMPFVFLAITRNFSTQDGNLTGSVSGQQPVPYLDLDLSFQPKPSGDIYKKTDMQSVIQSVKNICLTNRFERPFQPNFGCDLESTKKTRWGRPH